jgi:hypothetical protein
LGRIGPYCFISAKLAFEPSAMTGMPSPTCEMLLKIVPNGVPVVQTTTACALAALMRAICAAVERSLTPKCSRATPSSA